MPDQRTVFIKSQMCGMRKIEMQRHSLDRVFGPDVDQLHFFHDSGVEYFCDSAVEGYASTVFCFGQTGSGKTYSMSGPLTDGSVLAESAGIQFRAAHYIMNAAVRANESTGSPGFKSVVLRASYFEVYNEQVNDLLNDTQNLKVRWSQAAQSFFVEGLMIVQIDSIEDFLAVLEEGANNRKRASHNLNVDSTRSHVIFTIYIERRDAPSAPPKLGKINFVDLAGSEKLKDSESSGVHSEETKSINKSLFALGNVIQCLSKGGGGTFVPYRDSTLTKLLMDSLGGSCKTLMVACITPSSRFTEESIRTISYAMRTKNIVNSNPTVRIDPRQQELYELRMQVEMLRKENVQLKNQLEGSPGVMVSSSPASVFKGSFGLESIPLPPRSVPSTAASIGQISLELRSPSVQSNTPSHEATVSSSKTVGQAIPWIPPSILNTQQAVALEVAERIQRDNQELRKEVSMLRNLLANVRAGLESSVERRQSADSLRTLTEPSPSNSGGQWKSRGMAKPPPSASCSSTEGKTTSVGDRASQKNTEFPLAALRTPDADLTPSTAGDALTDFGFRPAPKKAGKLSFGL
jgi:hypothetical protein